MTTIALFLGGWLLVNVAFLGAVAFLSRGGAR
jgi:hypothetical protein